MFRKRLFLFLRRLLTGDYDTGIEPSSLISDEFTTVEELINKVGERLREYDELRADRVSFSYRAIETVLELVNEGIIIANIDKKAFKFNSVAQSIFNVNQETFTFDSIEKNENNKEFVRLFNDLSNRDKVKWNGKISIQLPVRDSKQELPAKIYPIKNSKEEVKLVLIFIGRKKLS
ncbi:MAG: hypothetical protein JW871_01685 [Endomicrobiales bacterium]|nr:hypothetical protein [Endomicrobiales bacterium]